MKPRIVITGTGMVCAAGVGVEACWSTMLAGESRVGPVTLWDPRGMASHIAAQVPGWPTVPGRIGPYEITGRPVTFGVAMGLEALAEAGLAGSNAIPRDRRAVVVAGGFDDRMLAMMAAALDSVVPAGEPSFESIEPDTLATAMDDDGVLDGMDRYSQVVLLQALAHHFGARQAFAVSTACAGGATAVGDAVSMLRRDEADVVLVVGLDTLVSREMMGGFCNLTALSTRNDAPARASRPFDADRDGFVMGEGGAALVLEREDSAIRRGATILGELAGFGFSGDAYRLTDPEPSGAGMVLSMQRALDDAGLQPTDVSYVNAHGTSTAANDKAETQALRRLFGDHIDRVVVSATKSIVGHMIHGAGTVGAVAALRTVREGRVHPTANYETPDPACALDIVHGAPRDVPVDVALINAFGFGGQNATLAVRRARGATAA